MQRSSEIRSARKVEAGSAEGGLTARRGEAGKGTVGQVAGEKNIHARGDAKFSFSRR